jgi:hypothetical protein
LAAVNAIAPGNMKKSRANPFVLRTDVPSSQHRSKLIGIDIHVQVLPGQQGRLIEKLKTIYRKQQHTFPGTIQRYIFKDDISPSEISIWLI